VPGGYRVNYRQFRRPPGLGGRPRPARRANYRAAPGRSRCSVTHAAIWPGSAPAACDGCSPRAPRLSGARQTAAGDGVLGQPLGSWLNSLNPPTSSLSGIIASGPPSLGTLADCIIALSAAERGLVRHYRGGPEHRPVYRPGILQAPRASPDRDARTRCLSSLEEQ